MDTGKTDGNQIITNGDLWDAEVRKASARLEALELKVDHIDEMIHAIARQLQAASDFVDENRAALNRGIGMLDAGARMRGFLAGGKKREGGHGQAGS